VFIDETAITTNMVRVRGRCPRGERLVSHVPQGEWKTITCIAGLRHDRMTAPMVIEGAMDGPAFLAYIEKYLGPTLRRGDTVVMDNCRVHKVAGVEEAIEARGARVEYLPAYCQTSTQLSCRSAHSKHICGSLPNGRFLLYVSALVLS
jgi:hypothetical protein